MDGRRNIPLKYRKIKEALNEMKNTALRDDDAAKHEKFI